MGIGYLLGGLFCFAYTVWVGYFGGIKRNPFVMKLVKMKFGKNMKDDTAAKICIGASVFTFCLGIFLFVFGSMQG